MENLGSIAEKFESEPNLICILKGDHGLGTIT